MHAIGNQIPILQTAEFMSYFCMHNDLKHLIDKGQQACITCSADVSCSYNA